MREVSVEALREEVTRLRGLVTLTRVFHPSGARLHGSGTPITLGEIKAMQQAGIQSVHFADLAEADLIAQRMLSTETVDLRDLAMGDVLADNIFNDDGTVLCPPGTHIDAVILEGKLRFWLGEDGSEVVDVAAGEVLHLPSNLPHKAEALEDTLDVDVFHPPRQDWLDGSDAYLRSGPEGE